MCIRDSLNGVYIVLENWQSWEPTQLAFYMMQLSAMWENKSPFEEASDAEVKLFNKHVGSMDWWQHLHSKGKDCDPKLFFSAWDQELSDFRTSVREYLLY